MTESKKLISEILELLDYYIPSSDGYLVWDPWRRKAREFLRREESLKKLLSPGYEPGDGSMDGAQLVDGEWWHPVLGCDSLQNVVERVKNEN